MLTVAEKEGRSGGKRKLPGMHHSQGTHSENFINNNRENP